MTAIHTSRALPLLARAGALLDRWRAARALRAAYLRTLREMQALSDRDLADIGIARADIEDIARRHVYGE
jgi:uncharacterized protein YjiS (DUF1127 family)